MVAAAFLSNLLQAYLLFAAFLYTALCLLGLARRGKPRPAPGALRRFGIVVPAYNEEKVIAYCVESLKGLDYPRELFDVFVIADHCTDRTAAIAAEKGAVVYEHSGQRPAGKGHALRWATEEILRLGLYDALCYFDADSLAHPQFLRAMSAPLGEGWRAVQGRQASKNAEEGWIPRMLCVGHIIGNRFGQAPKHALGVSATLHGKGMCFEAGLMREHRWEGSCLTEDLDMQMKLVREGVRIAWAQEAVVYDEEPVTVRQYVRRAVRWTKGAFQVARRHMTALFARAFARRDLSALESAVACSMVYRVAMTWVLALAIFYSRDSFQLLFWIYRRLPAATSAGKTLLLLSFLHYPAAALYLEGAPFKLYLAYLLQPSLGIFRVPIYLWSVLVPQKDWCRTEHHSRVAISDLIPA